MISDFSKGSKQPFQLYGQPGVTVRQVDHNPLSQPNLYPNSQMGYSWVQVLREVLRWKSAWDTALNLTVVSGSYGMGKWKLWPTEYSFLKLIFIFVVLHVPIDTTCAYYMKTYKLW
jgi:hypothetical protein